MIIPKGEAHNDLPSAGYLAGAGVPSAVLRHFCPFPASHFDQIVALVRGLESSVHCVTSWTKYCYGLLWVGCCCVEPDHNEPCRKSFFGIPRPPVQETQTGSVLQVAERDAILRIVREARWVIGGPNGAAARLGVRRTTLHKTRCGSSASLGRVRS